MKGYAVMKKMLCLFLILILFSFSFRVSAVEADVTVSSDRTYGSTDQYSYFIQNGEITLTELHYPYPSEIDGYPVVCIAGDTFDRADELKKIVIPNSVTYIYSYAFGSLTNLESIVIPDSVIYIGDNSFANCKNLSDIQIAESALLQLKPSAFIGTLWFDNQPDNSALYLGNILVGFKGGSLSGTITSVEIKPGTVGIIREAFANDNIIQSVYIPDSVIKMGYHVFKNCNSLRIISVDINNPVYDSRDNCNAIIETSSNTLIEGCNNTIIPNTVTAIGEDAFYYRTGFVSITIPDSVIDIGSGAFCRCEHLCKVNFGKSVKYIGDSAFSFTKLGSITIPDTVVSIGDYAFQCFPDDSKLLLNIHLGKGVQTIGCGAFYKANVSELVIPASVTEIGREAFYCTEKLTKVVVGNPTVKIGDYAIGYYTFYERRLGGYVREHPYYTNRNLIIYGYADSTAQVYARNNGFLGYEDFKLIIGICSDCDTILTSDNTTITEMVPSTCTQEGLAAGLVCDYCGAVIIEQQIIPKLEHSPSEAVIENTVSASCKSEGSFDEVVYCSVCHAELSRDNKTIAKLPHTSVIDLGYPATCTENGLSDGSHCCV